METATQDQMVDEAQPVHKHDFSIASAFAMPHDYHHHTCFTKKRKKTIAESNCEFFSCCGRDFVVRGLCLQMNFVFLLVAY
jgi:hypothetical protein